MTTPKQILLDLLAGQSTADSIAERLRIPVLVAEAMLRRHETDDLVVSGRINDCITVYRLTGTGILAAKELKPKRARRGASAEPATPI